MADTANNNDTMAFTLGIVTMFAMPHKIQENTDKFIELLLYVCAKCATHTKFGAVKLNKILFFSDFIGYRQLGRPITGMEYQKLARGPAPRRLLPIQKQMEANLEMVIQPRQLWTGKIQRRPVNLRQPDLSLFSGAEIAIVDEIIEAFRDLTADEISEVSHEYIGWKAAVVGETIPYETVFVSSKNPSTFDFRRGELIREQYESLLEAFA